MVGGDVMEVMMTGGDGGAMTEDTLAQVVKMLQMEGQLTGGNQTIIIRQPGGSEIQMIQTTSNGNEVVVSKASEADIQALQASNSLGTVENINQQLLEGQDGQVMMVDNNGQLVEGLVQMANTEGGIVQQMAQGQVIPTTETNGGQEFMQSAEDGGKILEDLIDMNNDDQAFLPSDLQPSAIGSKSILPNDVISKPTKVPVVNANGMISIKINTGVEKKRDTKRTVVPSNLIKISTVTGQQKYQPPKFHKCDTCGNNFASKIAFLNHIEKDCPSKKKITTNNKGVTYTCVFCDTGFTSRLVLVQHIQTCDKAKSQKMSSIPSKNKFNSLQSKLSSSKTNSSFSSLGRGKKILADIKAKLNRSSLNKNNLLFDDSDNEDADGMLEEKDIDSEDDDKGVVYDDEEDLNEEDFEDDKDLDESAFLGKQSQKHLGPINVRGKFQCRDCNRTFSKEYQYNRHVKVCTNAPLNAARVDSDIGVSAIDDKIMDFDKDTNSFGSSSPGKRKRGRPKDSPNKKKALGPKIVSVDPKFLNTSKKYSVLPEFDDDGLELVSENSYFKMNDEMSDEEFDRQRIMTKSGKINDSLLKKSGRALSTKFTQRKKNMMPMNPICGLCGDMFKRKDDLKLHIQTAHSEDLIQVRDVLDGKGNLSSVKCPVCDLHFASLHLLLIHLIALHVKELKAVQEELEQLNLQLSCPFCNADCFSQQLLKEHIAVNHLDRLAITKQTNNVVQSPVDVAALLKEKTNGSLLPTTHLLSKQEKVLCPDCGVFLLKTYFEHHRCAAEVFSPAARKFVCSELQCEGQTFYKLAHLLTHLQQVHEKTLPCETESFENLTEFFVWLKKEETKQKMKYTKAQQRMKQGSLNSTWICHQFHNSLKDPSVFNRSRDEVRKIDRQSQCYSRIYVQTMFNAATTRYDGHTTIKYFSTHKHPAKIESIKSFKNKLDKDLSNVSTTVKAGDCKSVISKAEDTIAVSDASVSGAQPTQDADISDTTDSVCTSETPKTEVKREKQNEFEEELEPIQLDTQKEATDEEKVTKTDDLQQQQLDTSVTTDTKSQQQDMPEVSQSALADKEFAEAEMMLEKMLSEHDADATVNATEGVGSADDDRKERDGQQKEERGGRGESMLGDPFDMPSAAQLTGDDLSTPMEGNESDVMPLSTPTHTMPEEDEEKNLTESALPEVLASTGEITEVDDVGQIQQITGDIREDEPKEKLQQTQDDSFAGASSAVGVSSSTLQQEHHQQQQDNKEDQEEEQQLQEEAKDTSDVEAEEESMYVLPADTSEWQKVFQLLHSQLDSSDSSTMMSEEKRIEAKDLFTFEHNITTLSIEKQVEVFNRLCTISDMQMT